MSQVRTRFAPSPTGFMHIGGMRTALFNWLWARRNGGQFILRIDDTDTERNRAEALQPILDAFRWLQLDWDEGPEIGGDFGPYFQSERGELYQAACDQLLAEGRAFRDFDPPDVAKADREAAEKEKRNYLNVRRSLELSQSEIEAKVAAGEPFIVRLLMPRGEDRRVKITDAVRGEVEWDLSEVPDPVIFRANGTALYNLATVVDDAAMQITHVIRAEEHLSNVPTQVMLYEAMGHVPPTFAHIPFVSAPGSSKKLSKRDGLKLRNNPAMRKLYELADHVLPSRGLEIGEDMNPVIVAFYRELGFLPAGIINGLSRLGWSFDETTELMDRAFIIENFSLDRVVKKPAQFDPDKLMSYQQHWMNELRTSDAKAVVDACLPYLEGAGMVDDSMDREFTTDVIDVLGERLRVFGDVLQTGEFFAAEDALEYDEKAFDKRIRQPESAVPLLTDLAATLQNHPDWTAQSLEGLVKDFVAEKGIKLGDVIHALRVATTGKAKGVGMFETLALLGKDRCLQRIALSVARV